MKALRIAVLGASGRMGKEIAAILGDDNSTRYVSGHDKEKPLNVLESKSVDVLIDFSLPKGFVEAVGWCVKAGKPLVSGTTGLSTKEKKMLDEASKKIPIFWSANMSLGIAILENILAQLPAEKSFDFQIEEFHHSKKKDRPSGTAILLQTALEESQERKFPEPLSVRGGGTFGIHKIHLMGEEETLMFEHTALNRRVFARGAVAAAKWIHKKPAGLYGMRDLLKRRV